jgi:transcriptional regulator with XRE-family HTH domain
VTPRDSTTETPDLGDPALDERAVAVRFFRALRDWTQEALSAASGVDRTLISRYESGTKRPSLHMLGRLAAGARFPAARLEELLAFLRSTAAPGERRPPYREPPRSAEAISQAVAAALQPPIGEAIRGLSAAAPSDLPRAADRAEAPHRLARLLGFDPDRRRRLVELAEEYRSWAVAELAGEASVRAAAADPEEALELARFALFIAERVVGSAAWRDRLQGLEWGFVANARRVANDYDGAVAGFAIAGRLWEAGASGDPGLLDPSRLPDLEASLLRAQRQFPRALALLDRALAASTSPRRTASILLNKAFTHEQAGDVEAATAALAAAAPLLTGASEPRLVWVHRMNLGVA